MGGLRGQWQGMCAVENYDAASFQCTCDVGFETDGAMAARSFSKPPFVRGGIFLGRQHHDQYVYQHPVPVLAH